MNFITIEQHTVSSEGVTLDLILWRRFQSQMPGLLEATLALPDNQHLERCPAELPLNTVVAVPIPAPRTQPTIEVVSLWD